MKITAATSRQSDESDGEGEDEQSEVADEEFAYSEDDGGGEDDDDDDAIDEDEDDDDGDYDFGSKKKTSKMPKAPKAPKEPKIRIKREYQFDQADSRIWTLPYAPRGVRIVRRRLCRSLAQEKGEQKGRRCSRYARLWIRRFHGRVETRSRQKGCYIRRGPGRLWA